MIVDAIARTHRSLDAVSGARHMTVDDPAWTLKSASPSSCTVVLPSSATSMTLLPGRCTADRNTDASFLGLEALPEAGAAGVRVSCISATHHSNAVNTP